jgi:hypothetical protein
MDLRHLGGSIVSEIEEYCVSASAEEEWEASFFFHMCSKIVVLTRTEELDVIA